MQTLAEIVQSVISTVAVSMPEAAGDFAVYGVRSGGRAVSFTVRAAFTHVTGDMAIVAFAEGVEGIKMFVTSEQWTEETPPQPGDQFDHIGGATYAVEKVDAITAGVWRIAARKVS